MVTTPSVPTSLTIAFLFHTQLCLRSGQSVCISALLLSFYVGSLYLFLLLGLMRMKTHCLFFPSYASSSIFYLSMMMAVFNPPPFVEDSRYRLFSCPRIIKVNLLPYCRGITSQNVCWTDDLRFLVSSSLLFLIFQHKLLHSTLLPPFLELFFFFFLSLSLLFSVLFILC